MTFFNTPNSRLVASFDTLHLFQFMMAMERSLLEIMNNLLSDDMSYFSLSLSDTHTHTHTNTHTNGVLSEESIGIRIQRARDKILYSAHVW